MLCTFMQILYIYLSTIFIERKTSYLHLTYLQISMSVAHHHVNMAVQILQEVMNVSVIEDIHWIMID